MTMIMIRNMKMTMMLSNHLFKLANIWRSSRRTKAPVMTTSTVQRALVPNTRGRRQRRRRRSSMKEEKREVTISFGPGKPLEQSQSLFRSLITAESPLVLSEILPDSPCKEQKAGENVKTIPEPPADPYSGNVVAKHRAVWCHRSCWSIS